MPNQSQPLCQISTVSTICRRIILQTIEQNVVICAIYVKSLANYVLNHSRNTSILFGFSFFDYTISLSLLAQQPHHTQAKPVAVVKCE